MTKTILIPLLCLLCIFSFAQTPSSMTYQAVVRDNSGNQIVNQSVSIEFAVRQTTTTGTIVFEEYHDLIPTNQFGLFTAMIGEGVPTGNGMFNTLGEIPWGDDIYFLEVRATIPGEGMPQIIGVSQLLTVPYAYYAAKAASVENETDGDAENELIDDFTLEGTTLTISENGLEHSVDISGVNSSDLDISADNELITDISITDQLELQITEGGNLSTVDLSAAVFSTWSENTEGIYNNTDNIGIGTNNPNSTLEVEGSFGLNVTTLNGEDFDLNNNMTNAATVIFLCDVSVQDVTIHLVPATSCAGRIYKFRKMFTGTVTSNDVNIVATNGESVDGLPIYEMTNIYAEYVTIVSNGFNWYVIDHNKE